MSFGTRWWAWDAVNSKTPNTKKMEVPSPPVVAGKMRCLPTTEIGNHLATELFLIPTAAYASKASCPSKPNPLIDPPCYKHKGGDGTDQMFTPPVESGSVGSHI